MRGMSAGPPDEPPSQQAIAALVHELNNVLSTILGYAEIVHADAGDRNVDERDAMQILAATRRAIELTDEIAALVSGPSAGGAAGDPSGSEPDDEA
jgi:uncharacterized protein (DUF2342 family)